MSGDDCLDTRDLIGQLKIYILIVVIIVSAETMLILHIFVALTTLVHIHELIVQ